MDQRLINLYDEYTHKPLKRDEFIRRLVELTGSMAASMTVLPLIETKKNHIPLTSPDDPSLVAADITYSTPHTQMKGYLVMPSTKEKRGAVIVVHENRGLNEHIRDVARRVAKAGYIALAPDGLSPKGGTPSNEDEARGLFPTLDPDQTLANFAAAVPYLRSLDVCNGKVGVVGFCWGGAMANRLAFRGDQIACAVPYYGRPADPSDIRPTQTRLLLQYAGLDTRVNEGLPSYEEALKANKVAYVLHIYEGAQHAFNNNTSEARYNPTIAALAWERTLALFQETLR